MNILACQINVSLLAFQVVIFDGHGENGYFHIKTNDFKTGRTHQLSCPQRYLHEI